MEDIKIGRQKWTKQSLQSVAAAGVVNLAANSLRVGLIVAVPSANPVNVCAGLSVADPSIAVLTTTMPYAVMTIEKYGQTLLGPIAIVNSSIGALTVSITELFLNAQDSAELD